MARGPWILSLALGAVAAGGWAVASARYTAVRPDPWPAGVLILGFVVAKFVRVELRSIGVESISVVMTDAAFAAALLLGEPWMVPVGVVAAGVVHAVVRRPPLVKSVFNVGQELVGTLLGLVVFEVVRDSGHLSARTAYGALAGGLVVGLFSQRAVALVTRLAGGSQRMPLRSLLLSLLGSVGNAGVAVQAVYLGSISMWLALLPCFMLAVLLLGYHGVRSQQLATDRSDLLYRATAALHEQQNIDDGLASVLIELTRALRADWARMVLLTPEGAVTCLVEDGRLNGPMSAAQPVEESAARRLANELSEVTLFRAGSWEALSGPASVFSQRDTIAAPLRRGDEPAGVVLVEGRAGSSMPLQRADVDVVEMMARQIGVALEKGHLERSLHQLVELERQLTRQAFFDTVTGLANRNYLAEELERLVSVSEPSNGAVMLVDLDDFKMVNDGLGHVAGDELLRLVAERLSNTVGDRGLVARLGGDEFAVVLRNADRSAVTHVAGLIIHAASRSVVVGGREIGVGASVGIRYTSGASDLPEDLLRDADLALYTAKGLGKARYCEFEPEMHAQANERLELSAALTSALQRSEFVPAYQPIVDFGSDRMVGAEALLRWNHPERGELGPGVFLPLTEESGQIVELGWFMLHEALRQLSTWAPRLAGSDFYLSVNVSVRQLKEPDFAARVLGLLELYNVPGERLVMEITESLFIDDPGAVQRVMEEVADRGVRFALDDFGTGYSSLSQLEQLPLAVVKIDRSFITRLGVEPQARILVEAIIRLAGALRLQVVAEGIETNAQRDQLAELGCTHGQGWMLGRPTRAAVIETLLPSSTPIRG